MRSAGEKLGTGYAPDLAHVGAWIVTDGKAGDENQCIGLAETLGLDFEIHRVTPRPPSAGSPRGDRSTRVTAPAIAAAPWPDRFPRS